MRSGGVLNLGPAWIVGAIFIALVVLIPILNVIFHIPFFEKDILGHLYEYVLPRYIKGSIIVLGGVLIITFIIGVSCAYLISFFNFFGSKFLEWMLILPLAIPAYIMGFAYSSIFTCNGILYKYLPLLFRHDNCHVDVMNNYGAIALLSFSFYPYVYFFTKNAFSRNLGNILEASYALRAGPFRSFFRVVLPFCRISIVGALILVAMETLSDYGLVAYFGVETFSAGIFKVWTGYGDRNTTMALSAALILFVFLFLGIERLNRGDRGFYASNFQWTEKKTLPPIKSLFAFLWCFIVLCFAFIIPMSWLIYWGSHDFSNNIAKFYEPMINSFTLCIVSSFIIVLVSFYLSFIARNGGKFLEYVLKVISLGYALPGAVVAASMLIFFGFVNQYFDALILAGGFLALFMGFLIRFLGSSLYSLESSYAKIPHSIDEVTYSLKGNSITLFARIHAPLLKGGLFLAFIIVAIDMLKELPITMILSPFNFSTLSVSAFQYATDEQIYSSALPSILIVGFGLIPTYLLHYLDRDSRRNAS